MRHDSDQFLKAITIFYKDYAADERTGEEFVYLPNEQSCNLKFSACWTAGPGLIPLEPSFGIATCSHLAIMPIDKEQTDISSWSYCLHRIGRVKCFQITTKQHG